MRGDRTKIALEEKKMSKLTNCRKCFCILYLNQLLSKFKGYWSNTFALEPFKMGASSEKIYSRKQRKEKALVSQTNSAHNAFNWFWENWANQLRESLLPLTSWWRANLKKKPLVSRNALQAPKAERSFFCCSNFLEACQYCKMGKTKKDTNARVAGRINIKKKKRLCMGNIWTGLNDSNTSWISDSSESLSASLLLISSSELTSIFFARGELSLLH